MSKVGPVRLPKAIAMDERGWRLFGTFKPDKAGLLCALAIRLEADWLFLNEEEELFCSLSPLLVCCG